MTARRSITILIGTALLAVVAAAMILLAGGLTADRAEAGAPPPANDDFGSATVIGSLPFSEKIDTTSATVAENDPPTSCNFTKPFTHTVWYTYTPASNEAVNITTEGSDYDTALTVYTGTKGALSEVADACSGNSLTNLEAVLNVELTSGTTYHIMVADYNFVNRGSGGSLVFDMGPPQGPHYECYESPGADVGANVLVENQFVPAGEQVTVGIGAFYCAASEKNKSGNPLQPSLRCFAATSAFTGGQTVDVQDQYGTFEHTIGPLVNLCVPVVKYTGTPDTSPYYACYDSPGTATTDPDPIFNGQFGIDDFLVVSDDRVLLCVPSKKAGAGELELPALTCYSVSDGFNPWFFGDIETQFGLEVDVTIGDPQLVCTAATKLTPSKQAWPGDTDGDGCPDVNENQPKSEAANGGGRDWQDPWDYYDVNGDGVIDLLFDILGVIQHYSPQGDPPYDIVFDRGPTAGPNAWNMTAPDGVIDLLNDILGVIRQYGHNCA